MNDLTEELMECAPVLGGDPAYKRAVRERDFTEMGRLQFLALEMNQVTKSQEKTCHA